MKLFGSNYTKTEIIQRVGSMSQIAGMKCYEFKEGREKGVDAVDVKTGSGLCFTVLPGRSMDIAWLEHSGKPIGYITKAGISNSNSNTPLGFEWLRNFFGGMLTTCGLTHVGPPEKDGIWELGLHGRISNTPAYEVCKRSFWEGDDLKFELEGKMSEAVLYEECLVLHRKITAVAGENRIFISDVVENQGTQDTPLMLLYHINLGFPLVSEDSRLIASINHTEARDEASKKGIDRFRSFEAPKAGCETQVFFHDISADPAGNSCVGVVNNVLNYGFYLRYSKKYLPFFSQWKNMAPQDYVVGLEPGNCKPVGRNEARRAGELEFIKSGEKKVFHLEMGVLTTADEIRAMK